MTTHFYTTSSNTVTVTNVEQVKELLEKYEILVNVTFNESTGELSFHIVDGYSGFEVNNPNNDDHYCTTKFLELLAPLLEDELQIKNVETQGSGEATAWKYIVSPETGVTTMTL